MDSRTHRKGHRYRGSSKVSKKQIISKRFIKCIAKLVRLDFLEWIETKVKSPVKDSWGRLSAASNPSWDKLNEWINKGRPYSFVAIDTLIKLIPHPGECVLSRLTPRPALINPATIDSMAQVLREYSDKDKVPRVMQGIDKVIGNWEIIC